MEIRFATKDDLELLTEAEAECFPVQERAGRGVIADRINIFPDHYLLLFEGEELAAYINGAATAERDLADEMFSAASCHSKDGNWQMIFGLGVKEPFRGKGYAAKLLREFAELAKRRKKLGLVLTCKPRLVEFYSKFGYRDEGVCPSSHGGAVWHQMRLEF